MIARTGGAPTGDDAVLRRFFDRTGHERKRGIIDVLPDHYSFEGKRVLDFGCGAGRVLRHFLPEASTGEFWACDLHAPTIRWLEQNLSPPIRFYVNEAHPRLPHPNEHFELVYAVSVLTHIPDDWSGWLLELHRILRPNGLLLATFMGPATWEEAAARPVDEDRLGMAVVGRHREIPDSSGPIVLHSPWWIQAHWGRAFEILTLRPDGFVAPGTGHGVVLVRKRDVTLSRDELEAPDPDDPRELEAARTRDDLQEENAVRAGGEPDVQPGIQARKDRPSAPAPRRASGFRRVKRAVGMRLGPKPDPAPSAAWLEPILVDYTSRDGSTLMMRLLSTSPEIAVEPPYPYEKKYFAYLLRWARLLDRSDWPADLWSPSDLGSLVQEKRKAMLGPPPWAERFSFEPGKGERSMATRCFELAWGEYSKRAIRATRALHRQPTTDTRYYAEKHLQTWKLDPKELPEFRTIILLRDPRDVYLSISAFNEKRAGAPPIGQQVGESVQAWRRRFIRSQKQRLRWVARTLDRGEDVVIRYEDLVIDTSGQAQRLEQLLSVTLEPDLALNDVKMRKRHATSESAQESVGRWKTELKPSEVQVFARQLGAELRALGFEV